MYGNNSLTVGNTRRLALKFECYTVLVKFEQIDIKIKLRLPVEIAYFHRWELIKNLFKFTPIWGLKLINFSLGYEIYESH